MMLSSFLPLGITARAYVRVVRDALTVSVGCLVQSFPFPGSPKLSKGVKKKPIQANRDDANRSMSSSAAGSNQYC